MEIGQEYCIYMTSINSVVDQFFNNKKRLIFWRQGSCGSGRRGSGLGLGSQVVLRAFSETSLLETLEPHALHRNSRFLYFILDNNP